MDTAETGATAKAAILVVAAMTLIGLLDTYVYVIAGRAGLGQFHMLRAIIAIPLVWAAVRLSGGRLTVKRPVRVAVRSMFFAISMLVYFGALAFLPVASVAAGLFTAPIFVLLISVAFLRERVGWRRVAAVGVGFAGILLVLRPGSSDIGLWVFAPIVGGLFYAIAGVITRRWCAEESTPTMLVGFFLAMIVLGGAGSVVLSLSDHAVPDGQAGFVLRGWGTLGWAVWVWIVVQAVGSSFCVGLVTKAYQSAETSAVAIFEYSLLITAAFWGLVLRGQAPDAYAISGMAMIVVAGAVLALRGDQPGPLRTPA